jgi:hypothetical protein
MLTRFPRISRVATKLLEISGAACASALAAVLLGNMREPAQPAVAPAVVRLAPADEQMIRYVREEGAALVEQLRTASDALNASPPAAAPASAPSKPAKTASSPPPRREQKANHAPAVEPKQRTSEPLPTPSTSLSSASEPTRIPAANISTSERMPPPPSAASEVASVAIQTQVPLRIWPAAAAGSLRDAPRPPRGVGEFLSSSM